MARLPSAVKKMYQLLLLSILPFVVVSNDEYYHYNVCNGLSNQLLHHASSIAKAISLHQNVEIPNAFIVHGAQHTDDNVLPTEKNSIPLLMAFDTDSLIEKLETEYGIQARIASPDFTNSEQLPCAGFGTLAQIDPSVIVSILQSFRPSGIIQNVVDHAMKQLKKKVNISDGVCVHHRDGKDWHDHCQRWESIQDGIWRENCLNDKTKTFEESLRLRAMNNDKRWIYYVGDHEIPQDLKNEFRVFSKDDLIDDKVKKKVSSIHRAEGERDIWALIDYNICTNLPYFIGNSVSTWSALQLAQRNGRNSYWYNSGSIPLSMFFNAYQVPLVYTYTELSPEMGKYMLKTSISSARQHMPTVSIDVIYNGHEDKEFHQWLTDNDVTIHDHDPSWMDDIETMRQNGNVNSSHLFRDKGSYFGTWQRIDIPKFIHSEFCLLLDLDTVVASPLTFSDFGLNLTTSIALSYEQVRGNRTYLNAGVALMNVPKLRETYDDFSKFIMAHKDGSGYKSGCPSDQGAYMDFFSDTLHILPTRFNIKPYWELNQKEWKDKKIIHFHACKVHDYVGHVMGMHHVDLRVNFCNEGMKQKFLCSSLQSFAKAAMRDDIRTLEGYCNTGFSGRYDAVMCSSLLKVIGKRQRCKNEDLGIIFKDVTALIGDDFAKWELLTNREVDGDTAEPKRSIDEVGSAEVQIFPYHSLFYIQSTITQTAIIAIIGYFLLSRMQKWRKNHRFTGKEQ